MKFLSQIQSVSLREQVVEQVRSAIIEGRLKPGDHITEVILTEQLGVSRTPVREALILLEREGLVMFSPNRGAFVRAFQEDDIEDIFSLRTMLENFAAELCIHDLSDDDLARLEVMIDQQRQAIRQQDVRTARSLDMEFHRALIHAGGNRLLVRSWEEIVAQFALLLYLRASALPEFDESQAIRDHCAILEGYQARDLAAVQETNRYINQQVAEDCRRALRLLEEQTPV